MKSSVVVMLLLLTSIFLNAQTTLDEIIGDMTLPHEGLPHGVPTSFDWQSKPRKGAPEPGTGWSAAIAWGQVYEWAGGNSAVNTRIQIKDLTMYYLSKKDNKWHLLQSALKVSGANYVEDFAGDVNKSADTRIESDGSISVTCGGGYNYHFWPSSGRIMIPVNDVAGCYVTVKARLIVNNNSKPDDRDKAKYLMSVGGDWWLSLTAPWDNWKTNWDIGIGRFRYITSEWKSFSMYSVPDNTIRNNPPPFPSIATALENVRETGSLQLKITRFDEYYQVQFSADKNEKVSIFWSDITGRSIERMLNINAVTGLNSLSIAKPEKPGIYILKLCSLSENITKKIYVR